MKNEVKCYLLEPTDEPMQKRFIGDTEIESPVYRRSDTGELVTLEEAPPGAMWDCSLWKGWVVKHPHPDGHYYAVKLPNGLTWHIDSKCSNCTRPTEPHQCWVRHGIAPELTVDKNGDTCSAGAGSIWAGQGEPHEWHGFLRNGWLCR